MFMIGGLFYIFRETINYHKCKALLAAMLLLFFMLYSNFAELAFGIFGGYLIFGFAFFWSSPLIRSINRETDISFGVYLYGWPITKVLIFIIPDSGPLIINILSLALAAFFGLVSWNFIEKPAQAIFRRAAHGQNLFLTDQVK